MNKKVMFAMLFGISFITWCKASIVLRNKMIESGNEIQAPFHFSVMILLFYIVLLIFLCVYSKIVSKIVIYLFMTLQILSIVIEISIIKLEFEFLNDAAMLYILVIICYILCIILTLNKRGNKINEEKSNNADM